ncbi:GNAT family N-acetyltransferase [Falsiroseomonas tokyonensis]|uniref:GNAT family N-acetyltransferase n=1 Tax=Falsiroseomonas tokyonensis TaxID=430521 RepID=A0ABV7BN49_9PROT|nr:GNAT family N-acetyltransferase [Falsiroseomonas tokyonensis]
MATEPRAALIIRPVAPADHAGWLPLWLGYNAFYGRSGDTAPAEAQTALTWSRFFQALEPMEALVAEVEGRLVGLAHIIFHRNTSLPGASCYLQDLFAAPEMRGRGIGRALIEGVYDRARAAGAGRVYWNTHETNHAAMRLYDQVARKSGFVVYRHDL